MKKTFTSLFSTLVLCALCFSASAQTDLTPTPTPSTPSASTMRVTFVITAKAPNPEAEHPSEILLVLAAVAAGIFSVLVVSTRSHH